MKNIISKCKLIQISNNKYNLALLMACKLPTCNLAFSNKKGHIEGIKSQIKECIGNLHSVANFFPDYLCITSEFLFREGWASCEEIVQTSKLTYGCQHKLWKVHIN